MKTYGKSELNRTIKGLPLGEASHALERMGLTVMADDENNNRCYVYADQDREELIYLLEEQSDGKCVLLIA